MEEKTTTQNQEGSVTPEVTPEEKQENESELDSKTILAQKEHFRGKFEKSEALAKEQAATIEKLQAQVGSEDGAGIENKSNDTISSLKEIHALRDYNPTELDAISIIARGQGVSLAKAAETDMAKSVIKDMRAKVEAENSAPTTTNRGAVDTKSELSNLSNKEIAEDYDNVLSKALEQGKAKRKLR